MFSFKENRSKIMRHSVYSLVDEVLRCGKIMSDKKKTKKNRNSVFFFLPRARKTLLFIFSSDVSQNEDFILFFFLLRGQKDPCWRSLTKQYAECGLKLLNANKPYRIRVHCCKEVSLEIPMNVNGYATITIMCRGKISNSPCRKT